MVKHVLMDVEGTTTSIAFVRDTLFPYAASALEEHLRCGVGLVGLFVFGFLLLFVLSICRWCFHRLTQNIHPNHPSTPITQITTDRSRFQDPTTQADIEALRQQAKADARVGVSHSLGDWLVWLCLFRRHMVCWWTRAHPHPPIPPPTSTPSPTGRHGRRPPDPPTVGFLLRLGRRGRGGGERAVADGERPQGDGAQAAPGGCE